MKKRLMLMIALLGMQNSMQALSIQELKFYVSIASYVVIQKIKSYNPFGKAVAPTQDDDDFSFDEFATPAPKKTYTFKRYKRKYNALGQKISGKKKKK